MESNPRQKREHPKRSPTAGFRSPDAQETGKWEPPTVQRSDSDNERLDTVQFVDQKAISGQVFGTSQGKIPKIGKYHVRGILGMGGMGIVYRGFDPMIEREVAIKVLPQEVSDDSIALRRFLQEARAAGKVNHPNVATIYETGEQNGLYYLVMELLPGGNLSTLMRRGTLTWRRATTLIRDCCLGLAAMHEEGLVHRDIKPGNLMLTAGGQVKVGDFGLVKSEHRLWKTTITKHGEILGTPEFMSPEQSMGQQVDATTDIYSLGATYYALLVGKPPFQGNANDIMAAHCHEPVPDPCLENPKVPPACVLILRKAMAKDPRERYQNILEMKQDLELVLADPKKAFYQLGGSSGMWPVPARGESKWKWLWFAIAVISAIVCVSLLI